MNIRFTAPIRYVSDISNMEFSKVKVYDGTKYIGSIIKNHSSIDKRWWVSGEAAGICRALSIKN